ncbi:MAG: tripartite tricarboxylate transporter permease [Neisseriaceae bacterium]|nr:tripartite tricarboxylate transporter permease [Neisseriaceae bacterium]
MNAWDALIFGLKVATEPENLFYGFIGCLLGTVVGVLPGIGTMSVIAMLLPLTYVLSPVAGIIMLAGIYYGAQYGGNTSAVLLGVPGESSAAVSTFDGHQMAKNGRAGSALAIAALSSFLGGCAATLAMLLLSPSLAKVALLFGSAEYCLLMLLGLIGAMTFANGHWAKTLGMTLLGLLLSTVGMDEQTGMRRFDLGLLSLQDGFDVAVVAMGLFGLAEVIQQLVTKHGPAEAIPPLPLRSCYPNRTEVRQAAPAAARGTVLGIVLGVLPGIGATIASFAAYTMEKRVNPNRHLLGTGHPAGLAAPEAANNASAQTSLIPLLTLGIPGGVVVALMVGALTVHHIQPGPNLMVQHPELFWGLIASMWVGNVILLVLNLPLIGLWVKLLRLPYPLLFPLILVFSTFGVYALNGQVADVYWLLAFGVLGYLMRLFQCEVAPLLLGFILGPLLEEHLHRALLLSEGSFSVFVTRPLALALLALCILTMWLMFRRGR